MAGLLKRLIYLAALAAAVAPPIVDVTSYAMLVAAGFVVCLGELRPGTWRPAAALGLAALALGLRALTPGAAIEEGHNYFVYEDARADELAAVEGELPPAVFARLREDFLERYPPEGWCTGERRGCWRRQAMPDRAYAFSAESLWRPAKYSRVVDDLHYDDVTSLQAGFVNSMGVAWYVYVSDVKRESMPYYLLLEPGAASVGSRLCWQGTVMWPDRDGGYETLRHATPSCRALAAADVGRAVFALGVADDPRLEISFEESMHLATAQWTRYAISLCAVLLIAACAVRAPRREGRDVLVLAGLGAAFVALLHYGGFEDLIGGYPPFPGGDDGLIHAGLGRAIFMAALAGDWATALRGGESIFFFMPGLRYGRAFGEFLFADTQYGYLTMLLALPAAIYFLIRQVASRRTAFFAGLFFVLVPIWSGFGFSFNSYVTLYRVSYAEVAGYGAFFAALALHLAVARRPDAGRIWMLLVANLLLSVAIWMRPNLVPGAALLLLVMLWDSYRHGGAHHQVVAWAGMFLALLMPVHNIVFGGEFVLLTSASDVPSNLITPPAIYAAAASDLWYGRYDTEAVTRAAEHLFRWLHLSRRSDVVWGIVPNALVLLVVVATALGIMRADFKVRAIALVALVQHPMLWFYRPDGRYAYLAWTLGYVVCLGLWQARRERRRGTAPTTETKERPATA